MISSPTLYPKSCFIGVKILFDAMKHTNAGNPRFKQIVSKTFINGVWCQELVEVHVSCPGT